MIFPANEKRAFLLYYSLPLLFGRIEEGSLLHLAFLVGGLYRLLKDSISETDLQEAGVFLKLYCAQAPLLYGELNTCTLVTSSTCTLCYPLYIKLCMILENKTKQTKNTLFHPMVITIFIQINIQINVVGVLAAQNNLKVKKCQASS